MLGKAEGNLGEDLPENLENKKEVSESYPESIDRGPSPIDEDIQEIKESFEESIVEVIDLFNSLSK